MQARLRGAPTFAGRGGDAVDIIFDFISVRTFWKILLFIHFVLAVGLLAAVTLQAVAVLMPVRQGAGQFTNVFRPVPAASFAPGVARLHVVPIMIGMLGS